MQPTTLAQASEFCARTAPPSEADMSAQHARHIGALCRLKRIWDGGPEPIGPAGKEHMDREPDQTGPSDKEHQEWMAKLAHAPAVRRAAKAGEPPEAGSGHVQSPKYPPAQLGQGRAS